MRSFFSKPIRRPDLWAFNMRCTGCDWHTDPDCCYRVWDVMFPPQRCPMCKGVTIAVLPECPYCHELPLDPVTASSRSTVGNMISLMRLPRTVSQAMWGHFTCRQCDRIFDKWGRKVDGQ